MKPSLVVRDLSERMKIPPNWILEFADPASGAVRYYVTKEAMLFRLREYGFRSVETHVEPDPAHDGGWICRAEIYPNYSHADRELLSKLSETGDRELFREVFREITRPTVAHASANLDNVRMGTIKPFLRELAETRAVLRAARIYTGMGLGTREEEGE